MLPHVHFVENLAAACGAFAVPLGTAFYLFGHQAKAERREGGEGGRGPGAGRGRGGAGWRRLTWALGGGKKRSIKNDGMNKKCGVGGGRWGGGRFWGGVQATYGGAVRTPFLT